MCIKVQNTATVLAALRAVARNLWICVRIDSNPLLSSYLEYPEGQASIKTQVGEMEKMSNQISEKAKTNLQRNAELREKDNIFFNPQPGEKSIWIFDAEKIEPVEKEFDGKRVQRFQYTIKDPNTGQEKYWTASKRTSEQIDAYLSEGHRVLKIQRIGSGKDTRYNIMPS